MDETRYVQVTTEDDDLLQANFAGIVLRARKLNDDDALLSLTHYENDEPEFVLDWKGIQKLRAFLNRVWDEWR